MTELSTNPDLAEHEKGLSVLDLTGKPLSASVARGVLESLAIAYRTSYASKEWADFANLLYLQLQEQGWSEERFTVTAKWVALNVPFATLTLADFFKAPTQTLHSYSWVMREVHKDHSAQKRMEGYRYPGVPEGLWRYAEGGLPLPLEQFYPFRRIHSQAPTARFKALEESKAPTAPPPEVKAVIERLSASLPQRQNGMNSTADLLPKVELTPLDPDTIKILQQAEKEAKERLGK